MNIGQRIQQAGFANVRSATKSDFRSLISGKIIRSCCALNESGGADFQHAKRKRESAQPQLTVVERPETSLIIPRKSGDAPRISCTSEIRGASPDFSA